MCVCFNWNDSDELMVIAIDCDSFIVEKLSFKFDIMLILLYLEILYAGHIMRPMIIKYIYRQLFSQITFHLHNLDIISNQ